MEQSPHTQFLQGSKNLQKGSEQPKAFHVQLAPLEPSFQQEGDGQTHSAPPTVGQQGVTQDWRRRDTFGIQAHFWKGKTAYNVKSTPMSVQITENSTEFESRGFVFQFTECSLALLFFKKKHRKDKKNHINIIYTI